MDIVKILNMNYPGTQWGLTGTEYSGLEWLDESPKPTKAALEKQWADVEYKTQVNEVALLRRDAYVIESDPLNFKWQETQLPEDREAWLAKKAEIQARYPEPSAPES